MGTSTTHEEASRLTPEVASAAQRRERARRRLQPGIGTLVVGIALFPLVVAAVRALATGWTPVGDIGLILMRAQDVGTSNHPLLGTWTSASVGAGQLLNNPGPLWFDVLSPFVRLAGPSVGLVVGVVAVNAACIVLAAFAAGRAGGQAAKVIVTALSAGLAWSMGSELLFDAWQPHAMILPFWAFLVVVWALATGDAAMAPIAVGLASFIVQTHLSFVYVVSIIGVVGALGAVWSRRAAGPWRRPLVVTVLVAVVCWIQPVLDQLFGEGNMGALLAASGGGDDELIGLGRGARLVASVVALPPWWTRPGFSATIVASSSPAQGNVAGATAAVVGLLAVLLVLLATIAVGHRRHAKPTIVLGALALAAIGAAIVSMCVSPVNTLGLSPHQLRWLWPISTLVLAVPLVALASWRPVAPAVGPIGALTACVFCALALPMHAPREGPTADRAYGPSTGALVDQLDDYHPGGSVLFDVNGLRLFEPYSGPVLAALARNDVDVRVADESMVRQIGRGRRADGTERWRVFLLEGDAAAVPPAAARRVAYVEGLNDAERAELERLRDVVISTAGERGVMLNAAGADAAADGIIGFASTVIEPGGDAAGLEASGWIRELVANEWIVLPLADASVWQRYAELDTRRARFTVGLFEVPLS